MSAQIIWADLATFSRPSLVGPASGAGLEPACPRFTPGRLWAFDQQRRAVADSFLTLPDDTAASLEAWLLERCETTTEFAAHLRRVADLAVEIAGELRLPAGMVRTIERAGLLHDVGLLCLPGGLAPLSTRSAAESAEFLRRHPEVAADLIEQRPGYEAVAEIVRSTRERFDGQGWPGGLSGRHIPVGARVLAVAEALDSAMTPWVWSETGSLVEAVAGLVRGAGTVFDPEVVAACIRVLDSGEGLVQ